MTDRGMKLIQMVDEIVKDHSVDCMLIENKYRVSIKVSKTFASSESEIVLFQSIPQFALLFLIVN